MSQISEEIIFAVLSVNQFENSVCSCDLQKNLKKQKFVQLGHLPLFHSWLAKGCVYKIPKFTVFDRKLEMSVEILKGYKKHNIS